MAIIVMSVSSCHVIETLLDILEISRQISICAVKYGSVALCVSANWQSSALQCCNTRLPFNVHSFSSSGPSLGTWQKAGDPQVL